MNEWTIQDKTILSSWSIYLPTTAVSASVEVGGGPQIKFCLGPPKGLGQHCRSGMLDCVHANQMNWT